MGIPRNKVHLAELIHNLSKEFDADAVLQGVVIKVKDIRIGVYGTTEDNIVTVTQGLIKLLTIRYNDNIYTVLKCIKLVLFHELFYKPKPNNKKPVTNNQ